MLTVKQQQLLCGALIAFTLLLYIGTSPTNLIPGGKRIRQGDFAEQIFSDAVTVSTAVLNSTNMSLQTESFPAVGNSTALYSISTKRTKLNELREMLLKIVDQNHRYMTELIHSNLPSEKQLQSDMEVEEKIIYGHESTIQIKPRITTQYSFWEKWSDVMDFSQCKHSNCRVTTDKLEFHSADVVVFTMKQMIQFASRKAKPISKHRAKQYWVLNSKESSAYSYNHMHPEWNTMFNITATYRTGSTIKTHDFQLIIVKRNQQLPSQDYSAGKSRDMVAYVSNCESMGYNRLELMKAIATGNFTFDLFGKCGMKPPCEDNLLFHNDYSSHGNCSHYNSRYRFFFSFENSLCTEYITEKFWSVLESDDYIIPIVMGGISMNDYYNVAPPNSFIHMENFTSVAELQRHLRKLINDPTAFNSYHKWREEFEIIHKDPLHACELCRIANEKPNMPAAKDWAKWWNNPLNCRGVKLFAKSQPPTTIPQVGSPSDLPVDRKVPAEAAKVIPPQIPQKESAKKV